MLVSSWSLVASGFFVGSLLWGWLQLRRTSLLLSSRLLLAGLPIFFVSVFLLYITNLLNLPTFVWNPARLSISASIWHGYKLYYPADRGPILSMIYGPMAFLWWLPAMLWRRVTDQVVVASLLTSLIAVGPFFLICRHGRGKMRGAISLAAALAGVALLQSIECTRYIATFVHVDGVGVGFALLSCCCLMRGGKHLRWSVLAGAAFFFQCALWTKQTMLSVVLAQLLFLWLAHGARWVLRYVGALTLFGGVFFIALVPWLSYDFASFWLNIFFIPAGHPFRFDIWGILKVGLDMIHKMSIFLLAAFWLVLVAPPTFRAWRNTQKWATEQPWILLVLVTFFSIPLSIFGVSKSGGDINHFHSVYFAIATLSAVLGYVEIACYEDNPEGGISSRFLSLVLIAILASPLMNISLTQKMGHLYQNPQEKVVSFMKSFPGVAYFPWNPLESLAVEGKAYHLPYGLYDRSLAGYKISPAHIHAHIPKNCQFVIFRLRDALKQDFSLKGKIFKDRFPFIIMHYLPEFRTRIRLPGFSDEWVVLRRTSKSSRP